MEQLESKYNRLNEELRKKVQSLEDDLRQTTQELVKALKNIETMKSMVEVTLKENDKLKSEIALLQPGNIEVLDNQQRRISAFDRLGPYQPREEDLNLSVDDDKRPSVFTRLGSSGLNVASMPKDRCSRQDHGDKCRNWKRTGSYSYGNTCRYKHETFPTPNTSRRQNKTEKDMDRKDLRHKVRNKRDDPKEPRMGSASPKKKSSKRSNSRSRKGEHESKIKSTVVVTRHRSPGSGNPEISEAKKKGDGNWEDDSDDWPMDAAQLDYKEELTLERKRQQLQRELELELQKERMLNENVTITKTVSFSGSSSSSSSSDSGSISSSSGSSSSSSEEDSNESSSSTSSSSSSSSRPSLKKKSKKSGAKAQLSKKSSKGRAKDDYDKIKSSRAAKAQKHRSPSPSVEKSGRKKGHDKRNTLSMSPKRKKVEGRNESAARSNMNVKLKGPRTPSPVPVSRKQRQWDQSSSADSRSAEVHGRNKRHKKKKDALRTDKRKVDRGIPTPPNLSSPNRTALMPMIPAKKSKSRDESGNRRMRSLTPPMLTSRPSGSNSQQPVKQFGSNRYFTEEKSLERNRPDDRVKPFSRKDDIILSQKQRNDSRDRIDKRGRMSPRKDNRKGSLSPVKSRYETDINPVPSRKLYSHEKDKGDRHRQSLSPARSDRRRLLGEIDKKRDIRDLSPRDHDPRRDNRYQSTETHGYEKRVNETKIKRVVSPDGMKKGRDDRGRDYGQKDRGIDYEFNSWQGDHRKSNTAGGRRSPETRSRQEIHSQPMLPRNDRSRERDQDRKKRKDRDVSLRSVDDAERSRLSSPRRSPSPLHSHHGVRDIETLGDSRSRIYDSDIPPSDREYAYGFDPLHDHYMSDRILPPDYESDVLRGPSLYPSDVYSENRYRRDIKDPIDRYGPRDVISPREILPHREIISLGGRSEDYLGDVPLDDRSYDERWPRGRGRDDWDPYASVPPAPIPSHVAAALDEDRYGMPRRRRGSPAEWQQRSRIDDRESGGNHRPPGRGQMASKDGRSRSPPPPSKGQGSSRASWNERGNRTDNRNNDSRIQEDSIKSLDERKGRNVRKDRVKKKEDVSEEKPPVKEKSATKRPHSPTSAPKVPSKKRKIEAFDILKYHGVVENPDKVKKKKEIKSEGKPAPNQKPGKQDQSLIDATPVVEKDNSSKNSNDTKMKKREDRKPRKNDDTTRGDDEFSDWSDDDLDMFVDQDSNNSNSKQKMKEDVSEEKRKDKSSTRDSSQDSRKGKENSSRTSSKDRSNEETTHLKDAKQVSESKDIDNQESFILKEDTATDIDEYITAESVDYDPISDDELDALIEEPDDTLTSKPDEETEKSKIVDALDVDWSVLMKASAAKTGFVPGLSRTRFKAAHLLSRIGFSQTFAGAEYSKKIMDICEKQLKEEKEAEETSEKTPVEKEFKMEHRVAAFHVSMSQAKRDRVNLFSEVGPYRRALCARRDLQIRKMLCKPLNKFASAPSVSYTPQYTVVDKELYKQSLEFLKLKKSPEPSPQTITCS